MLRSKKRSDQVAAVRSERITVSAWDFANDSVGSEQAQPATDGGTLTPYATRIFRGGFEKVRANVAIAKTRKGPFCSSDGLKQSAIVGLQWMNGAVASALPTDSDS